MTRSLLPSSSRRLRLLAACAWFLAMLALPGMALAAPQEEPPPASSNTVPNSAWVLESVSITVAGVGFVVLTLGATILGRRDQILTEFASPSLFGTPPPRPKASEIKEMQDTGTPLVIVGLIVAGVGTVGMLVGGIWILAHRPKTSTKSSTKVSKSQPPPGSPAQARTLLLQTP